MRIKDERPEMHGTPPLDVIPLSGGELGFVVPGEVEVGEGHGDGHEEE